MLRLNSQYAKSYLREEPSPAGYNFKETTNFPKQRREVPLEVENYQRINRENDYERSSYANRRDTMHIKNKVI